MQKECSVKQVNPHYADGLLLEGCIDVQHANMEDDLAGLVARISLELESHPAVTLVVPFEAAGHDGICEGKKRRRVTPFVRESVNVQLIFMIQHCLKSTCGNVSIDFSVNGVT